MTIRLDILNDNVADFIDVVNRSADVVIRHVSPDAFEADSLAFRIEVNNVNDLTPIAKWYGVDDVNDFVNDTPGVDIV